MLHSNVDQQTWEMLGRTDPLWAVLTCADKRYGQWDPAEFYQSGQSWVDALMTEVQTSGLLSHYGCVMDFGCGPGRLTRHLAPYFSQAIGVDISQAMIARASEAHAGIDNVTFVHNPQPNLTQWADNTVDLLISQITLQHMSDPKHIQTVIGEFCRVLTPQGLCIFQLPAQVSWFQPEVVLFKALLKLGCSPDWLYQTAKLRPMTMTGVPQAQVLKWVEQAGGDVVRMVRDTSAGAEVEGYQYWVKKRLSVD